MLNLSPILGLFITGTDTGVGKTVIAAAIANWFQRRGSKVGVCKIAATGCARWGDQLVSEDAQYLARWSKSPFTLDVICPIRFAEPLAPAVAAQRAGTAIDWSLLQASLHTLVSGCDCMIVEGVGGIMVPMDDRHNVLDVACWLGLPAIVVARPGLGTINHTVLTVNALRSAGVHIGGVVINRYPVDSPDIAVQTNIAAIEKWGRVPVLCAVPDEPSESPMDLPPGVFRAIDSVDWAQIGGEQ